MSNFLQLVQTVHRECSVSGEAPGSVANQSGLLAKIVNWTADAAYEIEALHGDWNFMWSQHGDDMIIGNSTYSPPITLGEWDRESFYLNYTTSGYKKLTEVSYRDWRDRMRNGVQTNSKPSYFAILPDKSIALYPVPDAVYTMTADFWARPERMESNLDSSNIPVQYERVIITAAKAKYAEDRGDELMLMNAQQEFLYWLEKLEAGELPGQERRRKSTPEAMVVIPE